MYHVDFPIQNMFGTKIITLNEVIDINFAKTDMIIHKTNEISDDLDKKS